MKIKKEEKCILAKHLSLIPPVDKTCKHPQKLDAQFKANECNNFTYKFNDKIYYVVKPL